MADHKHAKAACTVRRFTVWGEGVVQSRTIYGDVTNRP